jgi:Holliday junction resolvasome RuvABC DNA-binding subunit
MIGAVVFVIVFVLFTLISLVIDLPPRIWVHDWFDIPASEYSSLINGIANGVIYGIIIWLVFSLEKMGRKKEPVGSLLLAEEVKELLESEPRESKLLKNLTEIKGIGPKRAKELKAAGVNTVSELAKSSPKYLSEKTGISIKNISKWIVQANEMIR